MSQIETELFHGSYQPNPPGSNPSRYINLDSWYVRNLASWDGSTVGGKAINTQLSQIAMSNLQNKQNPGITGIIQNPLPFYYRFEKYVGQGGEGGGAEFEYSNRRGYPMCTHGGLTITIWAMDSDAPNASRHDASYPGDSWSLTQLQGTGAASFTSLASVPQYLRVTFVYFIGASCPTKFSIQKNATAGTTPLGGSAIIGQQLAISGRGGNYNDLTTGTSLSPNDGSAYQSFWNPTSTLIANGYNRTYVTLTATDTVYPGQRVDYYAACKTIQEYDYESNPLYGNIQVDYNGLYTANVEQWGWPYG